MKTPSKLALSITTAVAIASPYIPKTVNITINPPGIVAKVESCQLVSTQIDHIGKRICEYRCSHNTIITKDTSDVCKTTFRELAK
jgi:hypothetical protein